jgi:NAD(P)-dependent dehydrogenase (short-subunit alcohol dehydrogenase family)
MAAPFEVNVFGVVKVTNAFLPHMHSQRDGTIVIIGSRSAYFNEFPVSLPSQGSVGMMHDITDAPDDDNLVAPQKPRALVSAPNVYTGGSLVPCFASTHVNRCSGICGLKGSGSL